MFEIDHTIIRNGEAFDVVIRFDGRVTASACRPSWNDPGWPAECEVTFLSAEFLHQDAFGEEDWDDCGGPLDQAETIALRAWLDTSDAAAEMVIEEEADWA